MFWIVEKKKYQPERTRIQEHLARARYYLAENYIAPKPRQVQFAKEKVSVPVTNRYSLPIQQVMLSLKDEQVEDSRLQQFLKIHEKKLTFSEAVLKMIDEKGLQPKEFYGRAGLDRKLFSALKNGGPSYQPSWNTAVRCCFALQLSSEETDEILKLAGYALSDSRKADLLIRYCIENKIWNLFDVDELLYSFGENILFK